MSDHLKPIKIFQAITTVAVLRENGEWVNRGHSHSAGYVIRDGVKGCSWKVLEDGTFQLIEVKQ